LDPLVEPSGVEPLANFLSKLKINMPPKVIKPRACAGFTGKGERCKFSAQDTKMYCGMHEKNPGKSKLQMEQEKAAKKALKNPPRPPSIHTLMHTHLPGEIPVGRCPACEKFGDIAGAGILFP